MSKEIENSIEIIFEKICSMILLIIKNTILSAILGIKTLFEKRSLLVFFLTVLVIGISLSIHLLFNLYQITILPGLIYVLVPGIIKNFSMLLTKNRSKIFVKINFKDKNGCYPNILKIINCSKGREIIICKSLIPYKTWIDNIELLQTAFNSKLRIVEQSKQIVKLICLTNKNKKEGVWDD
jgi:hypothetical protein